MTSGEKLSRAQVEEMLSQIGEELINENIPEELQVEGVDSRRVVEFARQLPEDPVGENISTIVVVLQLMKIVEESSAQTSDAVLKVLAILVNKIDWGIFDADVREDLAELISRAKEIIDGALKEPFDLSEFRVEQTGPDFYVYMDEETHGSIPLRNVMYEGVQYTLATYPDSNISEDGMAWVRLIPAQN